MGSVCCRPWSGNHAFGEGDFKPTFRGSNFDSVQAAFQLPSGENRVRDDLIDPGLRNQHSTDSDMPPATLNDLRYVVRKKLHKRNRQRGLLPENSEYSKAKYDSYFVPGAMSDDEDEYKLVGGVWVKSPMCRPLADTVLARIEAPRLS